MQLFAFDLDLCYLPFSCYPLGLFLSLGSGFMPLVLLCTPSVPIYNPPLLFSHFLIKVVSVVNVSILCVNITKLSFVCMCIKFDFSYFKIS